MSRVNNIAGIFVAVLTAVPVMLVSSTEGWSQGIEEIVVTTRRKSESLQEVPIAVTAMGTSCRLSDFLRVVTMISSITSSEA